MKRLVKVIVLLMVIGVVGEVVVFAAGRLSYRDPFARYEALIPGQSVLAFGQPPCDLHPVTITTAEPIPQNVEVAYCVIYPIQSAAGSVYAYAYQDRFVRTSLLAMRDLYVGDVVLRWGQPDAILKD